MVAETTGRRDLPILTEVPAPPARFMWFGKFLVRRLLGRYDVRVDGLDRIPASGPVILASNHMGYLDGPMLFGTAKRRVHAMVKESMFTGPMGFGLTLVGQICVDRYRTDPLAVKKALRVLTGGGVLAIYPEGARGRGDVATTKGGAAYLALVTGAPVVPVACLGTRLDGASLEAKPPYGSRLDLRIGEAMRFDRVPWPRTKQTVADVQATIQRVLAEHVRQACEQTGQTLPALAPMPTAFPDPPAAPDPDPTVPAPTDLAPTDERDTNR
jgi:1-acyl-sn-glycerol-3-phosphate acyltransferase